MVVQLLCKLTVPVHDVAIVMSSELCFHGNYSEPVFSSYRRQTQDVAAAEVCWSEWEGIQGGGEGLCRLGGGGPGSPL